MSIGLSVCASLSSLLSYDNDVPMQWNLAAWLAAIRAIDCFDGREIHKV